MTETRRQADSGADPANRPDAAELGTVQPSGLAGWLLTGDHKRIGRLYVVTALAFLLLGGLLGAFLGVERLGGLGVLDDGAFAQVSSFHGATTVLLFLVPMFLGLATAVVPLQVGAANVAFPRGSATAYWLYLVSGLILVVAYVVGGGPAGTSVTGSELWALSLVALTGSSVLALVSVIATVLTMRAPGMGLDQAPLFCWSLLVGGGLFVLTAPVLMAGLVLAYVQVHFGGVPLEAPGPLQWFFVLPHAYLLAVPAAGVVAEVVPVFAGRRQANRGVVMGLLAALAVLGFGAFAQAPETFDDLLYVALGLVALVPAVGLLGGWADTLRRGRPRPASPLLLAMGAAVMLFLGALAGAAAVIEPLGLAGTVWLTSHVHYTLFGAGALGAFAGLFYWAPKLWGCRLSEGLGRLAFAALFLGVIGLAAPDLWNGLVENVPAATADVAGGGTVDVMNVLSLLGGLLSVLGVLAVVAALVAGAFGTARVGDDPWGGHTLEWATASPPPPANFDGPLPPVRSPAPLLDARTDDDAEASA